MSIILIAEDNISQANYLKNNLIAGMDGLEIIIAASANEAYELSLSRKIDLFILDIGLPDKSGIELAENIRKCDSYSYSWIIFVTASKDHFPKAFKKIHCYDYIIKPYNIQKVKSQIYGLIKNKIVHVDSSQNDKFTINCKDVIFNISIKDILFLEVYKKVCKVYTYNHVYEINRLSLKEALLKLPSSNFIQCHKSMVVNKDYIESIDKNSKSWEASLYKFANKISIGDKYKDSILKSVNSNITT